MTDDVVQALSFWGMEKASYRFIAGRENRVYRVTTADGDFALRIRRPGYRTHDELVSELDWLTAMNRSGLSVPLPKQSSAGRMLERLGQGYVDLVNWLPGRALGKSGEPLCLEDRIGSFRTIGAQIARFHTACDAWVRPKGFCRCNWDKEGLLGDRPVWGRFWENPTLSSEVKSRFVQMRHVAAVQLAATRPVLDHGLIHADFVLENLLLDGSKAQMIDFDDGGFGYRQFDLATLLLKISHQPDYTQLRAALIQGYLGQRTLDLAQLDLFIVLRALTYVGWVVPRMDEIGSVERNARFVASANKLCAEYLETTRAA